MPAPFDHRVPPYLGRIVNGRGDGLGTCFQIAPGLLATARHVLDSVGAAQPGSRVAFDPLQGGKTVTGTVQRIDDKHDLAVFQATDSLLESVGSIAATDDISPLTPIIITGVAEVYDPHHVYRHMDAPGSWQGVSSRDNVLLARLKADAVVPGMSGAPVRRLLDDAVVGVVSGRYNSADGWLEHSVWVMRTEHVAELLADLHPIVLMRQPISNGPVDLTAAVPLVGTSAAGRRGSLPAVWNLPPRNRAFVGREEHLAKLRKCLGPSRATAIVAFHGIGGIGKTQLALEFVHRYARDYDIAWWIRAEHPGLIGEQIASLAKEAGWVGPEADTATAMKNGISALGRSHRWLLVFDNSEDPERLRHWLPEGDGNVLITSRNPDWTELATTVRIDVMSRSESMELLRSYQPSLTRQHAEKLAEILGDLPLALAQAGGFLSTTGSPPEEYLTLLRDQSARLLREARPKSYPTSLAAAIDLSLDRLRRKSPAAVGIMRVCAFLAPVPIPTRVFSSRPKAGGGMEQDTGSIVELAAAQALQGNPIEVRLCVGALIRYGLGTPQEADLQVHRLTQAVVRDGLARDEAARYQRYAEDLVAAVRFDDPNDASTWTDWAHLLPHVLAVDPAATSNADLRYLAGNAAWYLIARGDPEGALQLASHLYNNWRTRLGPDNENALAAAHVVAQAYAEAGRLPEARKLNEEIFARRKRTLGPDHLDTLDSAANLAVNLRELGELDEARRLQEETLGRWRAAFGADHPRTLLAERELMETHARLGDLRYASELIADVYKRHLRVLGANHPYTLSAAHNMARMLLADDPVGALALNESTLRKRINVLGADHPDTRRSLAATIGNLQALGEQERAAELQRCWSGQDGWNDDPASQAVADSDELLDRPRSDEH